MKYKSKLLIVVAMCMFASTHRGFSAPMDVSDATFRKASQLKSDDVQSIENFPVGPARNATIRLKRVELYADDAHVYVATSNGQQEISRSTHIFLRGTSDDGTAIVAVALNEDGTFSDGGGNGPDGSFVLSAERQKPGVIRLSARTIESTLPKGFQFEFQCGDENIKLPRPSSLSVSAQLERATHAPPTLTSATAATLRYATVAIDTDSPFMSTFANNTTNATNWIAGMFNVMNTMYENDLQVQLLQGTTILRTDSASDPYKNFVAGGADSTKLNFFANYWHTNESSVPRVFAALLSGINPSTPTSCGASGIASIDAYCDTSRGYSVTQVCTSLGIDPNGAFNAGIVGHEIGHNFGADHTHCTNISDGTARTGTNTIDKCANETNCYSGATSCPAAGSGTIMSYCNMTNQSHCASGTQNQRTFHPTQINDVLLPDIAAHTPSCLSTTPDVIFKNGFQ